MSIAAIPLSPRADAGNEKRPVEIRLSAITTSHDDGHDTSLLFRRKGGLFLELRRDRIQLCGGDHCAAALISVFERWTVFARKTNKADGWLLLSKEQLRDDTQGIWSEWSIRRAIGVLCDLGILAVRKQDAIGHRTAYLLRVERANELLRNVKERKTPPPTKCPNRKKSWLGQRRSVGDNTSDQPSVITPASDGESTSEAVGVITRNTAVTPKQKETNTTPPTPSLEESKPEEEENPEVKTAEKRDCEEPAVPLEDLQLDEPVERLPPERKRRRKPGASATNQGLSTPQNVPPVGLPPEVERWNEVVTAGQRLDSLDPRYDAQLLARLDDARGDPKFRDGLDQILQSCQSYLTAKPEAKWMDFEWLVKEKNGQPGWYRALRGSLDRWASIGLKSKSDYELLQEACQKLAEMGGTDGNAA